MLAIDERKVLVLKALNDFYYAAKQYAVVQPYFEEGMSIGRLYYATAVAQKILGKNAQRNRPRLGWLSGAEVSERGGDVWWLYRVMPSMQAMIEISVNYLRFYFSLNICRTVSKMLRIFLCFG